MELYESSGFSMQQKQVHECMVVLELGEDSYKPTISIMIQMYSSLEHQ